MRAASRSDCFLRCGLESGGWARERVDSGMLYPRSVVPLPHLRERLGEGAAPNSGRVARAKSGSAGAPPSPCPLPPKGGRGFTP